MHLLLGLVALTRELGKNEGLRCELEKRGIDTVELPCVAQTRDANMEDALDNALRKKQWNWMVVTSPEAAKALDAAVQRTGIDISYTKIAAVGDATAKALDPPYRTSFTPSKSTAATLGKELPGGEKGDSVLFPASALAAKTLEQTLGERGFAVERVNSYTTVPATWTEEDTVLAAAASIVAFGSPSAVDVWVDRVGASPRAACIGETTAKACDAAGFHPKAAFPEKPGLGGWADEIAGIAEELAATDATVSPEGIA